MKSSLRLACRRGASPCWPSCWRRCSPGCTTIREARGGPGPAARPVGELESQGLRLQRGLDKAVLKPVATVYADVVPQPVRRGVGNFFSNFADAWSAINNMLQGKFAIGFEDVTRVGTNTLFGLFGILDVATEMGLDHHYEDFGQTLGRWGVGAGAYVVLPILGPSTRARRGGAAARPLASPPALFDNNGARRSAFTLLQIINTRADLLGATRVIDDIALDKYTFIRDAYLQRRRSLVFDGDAPETPAGPRRPASPLPAPQRERRASGCRDAGTAPAWTPAQPAPAARLGAAVTSPRHCGPVNRGSGARALETHAPALRPNKVRELRARFTRSHLQGNEMSMTRRTIGWLAARCCRFAAVGAQAQASRRPMR